MKRLGHLVGTLVISSLLAGCGESGESTATPANLDDAANAAKKMQLREAAAAAKNKPASGVATKPAAAGTESVK